METPQQATADRSLDLWHEYRRTANRSLRNRLVLTYVPLVKHVVYKKLRELPVSCEADELISCGIEGLIGALDQYDPDKGAALEPYLWTRIHGSVLDELRRRDWAPRSLRRFERDIERARDHFTGAHGRPPTREELADLVSLTPGQLRDREQEIENSDLTSLSSLVVGDGDAAVELVDTLESGDETSDPEHVAEWGQAKERFRSAFAQLSRREQQVAVLLYVKNLTLREIGQVLGVSESRVSQMHSQLKRRVRERLKDDRAFLAEVA
jgi:RNA polymerase sigma factor for flagellar operon FliA